MISSDSEFTSDWASPPGRTIGLALKERSMSAEDFNRHLGLSKTQLRKLLSGETAINIGMARKLVELLGSSVEFWIERDHQYRQKLESLRKANEEFLAALPVEEMTRFGWLDFASASDNPLGACLDFFGISNGIEWFRTYRDSKYSAAFRTSSSFQSRLGPLSAWLRQGDIVASQTSCAPWNASLLEAQIPAIRSLTRIKNPKEFLPTLRDHCAKAGVAIAIVRAPTGCRASGAVRFVSPQKALVQLSFRYLSDDHFWFSLFHEVAHLLLHKPGQIRLEEENQAVTEEEREANEYSANVLIPAEHRKQLQNLNTSSKEIIRFAVRIGISPGIVVGQLQHMKKLQYNQRNSLKRRFEWE